MKIKNLLIVIFIAFSMISTAQPPGSGWTNVFADEFSGSSLNTSIWTPRTNGVFVTDHLTVGGGVLTIKNTYTSNGEIKGGWVGSNTKFSGNNKYGYYEARIRVNGWNQGSIWPTWWIWGGNWRNGGPAPSATEFDLMEYSGFASKYYNNHATTSHHYRAKAQINGKSHATVSYANTQNRDCFNWHVWGMLWTPTEVSFYYDGVKYFSSDQPGDAALEDVPMQLLLSSSPHTVNADPEQPDHPVPANAAQKGQNLPTFQIDWVRVHRGGTVDNGTSNQKVSLKNMNKYVSSEDGLKAVNCNRTSVGDWEKFEWITTSDNKTAFKGSNGKYLSSEDGLQSMTCSRSTIGDWEKFTVEHLGNQVYAIKGNNGLYVSSENGTKAMMCNRSTAGDWEKFAVTWGLKNASMVTGEIEQKEEQKALKLFPNPASNQITINVPSEDQDCIIKLFDSHGRIIRSMSIPTNTDYVEDISELEKGLYFIQATGLKIQKLVVK
ncbi:T9SS type A sorting domain-containing protein [Saccharicrinis aurantiacus]|uniref:T9SS type A sorting domain-containing protein n=1 Tax=Saccharicrinis aurantiacus TaxID=1849719 RepID=UPI0009502C5A|nr:T9SS type A sorting domain-containing protein [Saccharicrinis aurantiacus]